MRRRDSGMELALTRTCGACGLDSKCCWWNESCPCCGGPRRLGPPGLPSRLVRLCVRSFMVEAAHAKVSRTSGSTTDGRRGSASQAAATLALLLTVAILINLIILDWQQADTRARPCHRSIWGSAPDLSHKRHVHAPILDAVAQTQSGSLGMWRQRRPDRVEDHPITSSDTRRPQPPRPYLT